MKITVTLLYTYYQFYLRSKANTVYICVQAIYNPAISHLSQEDFISALLVSILTKGRLVLFQNDHFIQLLIRTETAVVNTKGFVCWCLHHHFNFLKEPPKYHIICDKISFNTFNIFLISLYIKMTLTNSRLSLYRLGTRFILEVEFTKYTLGKGQGRHCVYFCRYRKIRVNHPLLSHWQTEYCKTPSVKYINILI